MNPAKKEQEEKKLHTIPLRITDTTLRDGHQSLWATRMRTEDMLKIIDVIDNVGYYSLECWGGATFDVCLRFLRENPWERLKLIKAKAPKTPLQMLLRGQNLVGYRNYADDVVDRFVALALEGGIDIFRCFDALNDTRNLEAAVKAVKRHGGHAQGTLCYTISPVHTVEKFVTIAKEQVALGVDSICIKDMAGILSPIAAERLVSALLREISVPIQLHCHASSGMSVATYVEAVRAGAGAIDCAISSLAGFSGQPPVETLAAIFSETNYSAGLDMQALEKIAAYFTELAPKRRLGAPSTCSIDPDVLIHQIPGGMISNFRSQLEKQKALDKLPLVLKEVTAVRQDLGWPPLVTPTSQIVGTMAVMNVIAGERYKMIPNEIKDYVRGLYGRSPAPMDKALVKKILGNEKPIDYRPGDKIEPMLPNATKGCDPKFIENEQDIVSYCMLPEVALEYFKWRALPPAERPPIPADVERNKDANVKPGPATQTSPAASAGAGPLSAADYQGLQQVFSALNGVSLDEIVIRKGDFSIALHKSGSELAPSGVLGPFAEAKPSMPIISSIPKEPQAPTKPAAEDQPISENATTIKAPLVGTFYSSAGPGKPQLVHVGDIVHPGDKVCIVEAMKLFNEIEAPVKCRIIKFLVADGQQVEKEQPLVAVEPL
ncbi:MAG: pyruvate carboxylase subunit B [Chitinivibrionales bacterium]|nr:pyruvate carboxylase subunit B [Chitinivibrionales bacterium]